MHDVACRNLRAQYGCTLQVIVCTLGVSTVLVNDGVISTSYDVVVHVMELEGNLFMWALPHSVMSSEIHLFSYLFVFQIEALATSAVLISVLAIQPFLPSAVVFFGEFFRSF